MPDVAAAARRRRRAAYLAGLVSLPRFRAAIDAKVHAERERIAAATGARPAPSLVVMLAGLPGDARTRFERLHARCVEMRAIAIGVRGAAGVTPGAAEEIRTPGLDRLLWLFLRLLMSKTGARSVSADDERARR